MYCLQNKFFSILLFLTALIIFSPSYAAKAVIDIKAQYLLLDENKGVSKYKGNVLFKKDSLTIKADTVTLFHKNKKLDKAIITGSPADVQHQPDNEEQVHSQAENMEFFVHDDRLILKGNAFVIQGNQHFSGEIIEYDTRQRIISASGKKTNINNPESSENNIPTGRVHVIIGPNENENIEKLKDE